MNDQKARQDLIHRYPVASFFILALLLGTGLIFLVVQGLIPAELALASALSASIAGILVTAVVDGILCKQARNSDSRILTEYEPT